MPEPAGLAALAAAVQGLSDNIAAMRVEVSDGLQQLTGLVESVDMSAMSQGKATELLQTLGLQVTVLSLETAIQVTGSSALQHCSILSGFFAYLRMAAYCRWRLWVMCWQRFPSSRRRVRQSSRWRSTQTRRLLPCPSESTFRQAAFEAQGATSRDCWCLQMQICCLNLCQSVVIIAGAAAPAVWISVEPVGCGGRQKQEAELVGSQKAVHGTWTWEKLAPCTNCCRRVGELALQHALALTSTVSLLVLKGCQDLGIFPAGAPKDSLAQMRMGFELKHTDAHKQLHEKQAKAEATRAAAEQKQAAEAEKWRRERQGPLGRGALAVAEQPVAEQPPRQSQRLAGRAATEPPSSQAVPGAQPHVVQACMSHMVNHIAPMNVPAGLAWDKRVRGQSILELLCNYRCVSNVHTSRSPAIYSLRHLLAPLTLLLWAGSVSGR